VARDAILSGLTVEGRDRICIAGKQDENHRQDRDVRQ
jgi:hypothetical protein